MGRVDGVDGGQVWSVEEFGPAWSPGEYELGTDGPRSIMVGVDGSRTSMRAASYAAGLARRQGSRLVVVYVASVATWASMAPMAAGGGSAIQETLAAIADEIRGGIRERVDELGVSVQFVVRSGDPYSALKQAATEAQADLVVVGASTSTGHRIVGSLAGRLVRAGSWPVTVVP